MYMTTGQLDGVKRAFYTAFLDDPILTLLILSSLDDASASDLPDFKAEPWRPQSNDGAQVLGIRFTRSLSKRADELAVSFATFHYLPVLVTSKERTEAPLLIGGDNELFIDGSAELMQLDTCDAMRKQAAAWFMARWQEALLQAHTLGAILDPMTGTLTMDPVQYVQ
jgi:hypothetical protein